MYGLDLYKFAGPEKKTGAGVAISAVNPNKLFTNSAENGAAAQQFWIEDGCS